MQTSALIESYVMCSLTLNVAYVRYDWFEVTKIMSTYNIIIIIIIIIINMFNWTTNGFSAIASGGFREGAGGAAAPPLASEKFWCYHKIIDIMS